MAGPLNNDKKLMVVAHLCRTVPKNILGYREDAGGQVTAITPEGRVFIFSQAQIEAAHERMEEREDYLRTSGLENPDI